MAGFGAGSLGSSGFGASGSSEQIFIKKKTITAPSSITAIAVYSGVVTRYKMKNDISESAGNTEIEIYSRAAQGESWQRHALVSGPGIGESLIPPGVEIMIVASVTGANQSVGVTGAG